MIPFGDLKRTYLASKTETDAAVRDVFDSGWFILGKQVEAFEREFAAYCGVAHAVGVASGTDALALALRACGVGPSDEVITAPNTAVFTALAITMCGATPTFADIDPLTYNLDPRLVKAAITPRTKAIIPVHLYGQCADMEPIGAIARRHGLKVVEDACQAHGATYGGCKAGTLGDAGCFSFYPSKNLGAYGDGGMVVTDDTGIAEQLRLLRNGGQRTRYEHSVTGVNSRLDELQAAILRSKLGHLDEWNQRRGEIAAYFSRELADTGLGLPAVAGYGEHVHHLYVVRSDRRDALRQFLADRGIGTQVHYPIPVHRQPAYAGLGLREGAFPEAEKAAMEILSLPIFPELTDDEAVEVAAAVREFAGR